MKEKLSYIIGGLVVYSILGLIVSYFSFSMFNWSFILFWAILMTLGDFFIIRNIKKWFSSKSKNNA